MRPLGQKTNLRPPRKKEHKKEPLLLIITASEITRSVQEGSAQVYKPQEFLGTICHPSIVLLESTKKAFSSAPNQFSLVSIFHSW